MLDRRFLLLFASGLLMLAGLSCSPKKRELSGKNFSGTVFKVESESELSPLLKKTAAHLNTMGFKISALPPHEQFSAPLDPAKEDQIVYSRRISDHARTYVFLVFDVRFSSSFTLRYNWTCDGPEPEALAAQQETFRLALAMDDWTVSLPEKNTSDERLRREQRGKLADGVRSKILTLSGSAKPPNEFP